MNKKIKTEVENYIKEIENQTLFSFSNTTDLKNISTEMGVYLIYDSKRNPLYVGFASNLKRRLKQQLLYYSKNTGWFNHTFSNKLLYELNGYDKEENLDEQKVKKFLKLCKFRFIVIKNKYIARTVEQQLIKKLTENKKTPEFNFIIYPPSEKE